MSPPLEPSSNNIQKYSEFIEEIVRTYNSTYDPKARSRDGKVLQLPNDSDNNDKANIVFMIGEGPQMPAKPEHCEYFLRFSSKISGSLTAPAERYIEEVYEVAKKYFGRRACFWHELYELDDGTHEPQYGWETVHDANQRLRNLVAEEKQAEGGRGESMEQGEEDEEEGKKEEIKREAEGQDGVEHEG